MKAQRDRELALVGAAEVAPLLIPAAVLKMIVRPLAFGDTVMLLTPTTHNIVYHVANLVYSRIQATDLCVTIFHITTMPVIEVPQIPHDLANLVDGR